MPLTTISEDQMAADLSAFLREFKPQREIVKQQHRLKIPGHTSMPFWAPRKKKRFERTPPSGDLYEPVTTGVMSFLLSHFEIDRVFDIGAKNGYFSLVASSFEKRRPEVHAFEMHPARYEQMEGILRQETFAERATPHLAGMSDRALGPKTVWRSLYRMFEEKPSERDYRESWWRRLKFATRGIRDRDALVEISIDITSIDEAAKLYGAPQLVKIDVEGYEARVIPGGINLFRESRPFLLFELHKTARLERLGATREGLMAELFACGYRAITFSDHHDCAKVQVEKVGPDSAAVKREKTDLFFLY